MSAIILNKRVVHYEVLGRGRPLIFLHGWLGTWRYWIPMMQVASHNYRTYSIDLWGFGDTAKDERCYAVDDQAALLKGFLDELGIGQVALIGHGLGAIVGLRFAHQNPGLVNRIMAISLPTSAGKINTRLNTETPETLMNLIVEKNSLAKPVQDDMVKNDARSVAISLQSIERMGLEFLWKQPELMCLMVHGQNDPLVGLPDQDDWKQIPYNMHAIVFEHSGHFPMIDEANKFTRLLVEFLALESGETPRNLQLKEEWKRRVR